MQAYLVAAVQSGSPLFYFTESGAGTGERIRAAGRQLALMDKNSYWNLKEIEARDVVVLFKLDVQAPNEREAWNGAVYAISQGLESIFAAGVVFTPELLKMFEFSVDGSDEEVAIVTHAMAKAVVKAYLLGCQ
jgi:hypothetical protein